MGATLILGGQWGDEGKGLFSAYLAKKENADYVVRAGTGSNAEHGIFLRDEETYLKTNQLPLGFMYNPNAQIRIGSGVAVDPVKLMKEIEKYNLYGRVKVDYRCPIIEDKHIEGEATSKGMNAIGSTMSGTGFCRADFVLRKAIQAKDLPGFEDYITDVGRELTDACKEGKKVIIECSQGFGLSLAASDDYPNTTSDNITTMAALDDVLLNPKYLDKVILVIKAVPSREGKGSFGKSDEISMEEIEKRNLVEPSSIGGVTRRKAEEIDFDLLKYTVDINCPNEIALSFLDHYDPSAKNIKKLSSLPYKVIKLTREIFNKTGVPVTLMNTGKAYDCVIDIMGGIDWEELNERLLRFK
jgi:adenylosuccinate synthase